MKFIFDFDDVLFNTAQFKEHMFKVIAEAGIPEAEVRNYYAVIRQEGEFSLKKFIENLFYQFDIKKDGNLIYEKIMEKCSDFLNNVFIKETKKLGKENCYLVTNGSEEFQREKFKYSLLPDLFKKIYFVPGTKKDVIEKICAENKDEKIIFIEDKIIFINDLDFKKYPNLKTILCDDKGLEKFKKEIKKGE